MDIDIHDVARLARLDLEPDEAKRFGEQLAVILEHFDTLDELDTSDVEPTCHVVAKVAPMRQDVVGLRLEHGRALENAPEHDGASFVVPKVI